MNRLAQERSPYLRHAANQKIDWLPWSDEAFARARAEDKPVFLSTGAVWCHWCHVMSRECFENDEIAALLNECFISVKLDRDERPDIDRRYQEAVAAMGGSSGWPLSVFLTPDREAFYGGTYFPPADSQGLPGFKTVLKAVSDFYRERRSDVSEFSTRVKDALKPEPLTAGEIGEALLAEAEQSLLAQVDWKNGGFGASPKFPQPGALEFLLRRSGGGTGRAGAAARLVLDGMGAGGFRDHLGGGFHRYSVDEAWTVPHFEKMADDNAGLLTNYIDGYALFGDDRYRDAALGIIGFVREVLADPLGGFYASQDADAASGDEGSYFTWTDDEVREVLGPDDYRVFSLRFLRPRGRMPHDPSRTVLAEALGHGQIAEKTGMSAGAVREALGRVRAALLARRRTRAAPFVDTTLYTSVNGMMAAAWLRAYMTFGDPALKAFAVKSLDRIRRERLIASSLYHSPGVRAGLDDYVHLIDAFIAAYEAAADRRALEGAEALMARCIERFLDRGEGGFFDTEEEILGARSKRIEDAPHPSGNAVAIRALLKLAALTGKEAYRREAERSLRIFAGPARMLGVHGGAYFCALDAYSRPLVMTVESAPESVLAGLARSYAARSFSSLRYGEDKGRIIPCRGGACYEPVRDEEGLARLLEQPGT